MNSISDIEMEPLIPDCCMCGKSCRNDETGWHYGHNPDPLCTPEGRCCDECNKLVVAYRIQKFNELKGTV